MMVPVKDTVLIVYPVLDREGCGEQALQLLLEVPAQADRHGVGQYHLLGYEPASRPPYPGIHLH